MITLETVIAFALRDVTVMDKLGAALRNNLVVANPFYRRIVEFADDFLVERRKLPGDGDWSAWLETVPEGNIRDGTREALGRLFMTSVAGHDPQFFAQIAIEQLRKGAAQVARARLNELGTVEPEAFSQLAREIEALQVESLQGLAHLTDVDTWAVPPDDTDRIPTGFPTLDRMIGGWGKELVIILADTGMGKSMMLQCCAVAAALRGCRVLHITLELGLRPQIHRYYRQIAQATRSDIARDLDETKRRLRHWLQLAQGAVSVMELPAYGVDQDGIRRVVERATRQLGDIDVLVLDYMDLVAISRAKAKRSTYEDLGILTHELRGLCPAFDLTVLTASQSVRRPTHKDRLTIKDMGDSYNKVRGCDLLLSLVQTEEEKEVHQGRLGVLKARDSGGGLEVPLYVNRELSLIAELSHPNTVELMRRIGHLPAKPAGQLAP